MRGSSLRVSCLAILLMVGCGYNPSPRKGDAGGTTDGAGGAPAPDAQVIAGDSASTGGTGGTSEATGGAGGLTSNLTSTPGGGGAGAGGITAAAGTGGTIVKQDAGPSPDTALADAPVACPALEAPSNGSVAPTPLTVGSQATYTCLAGYGPSPVIRTCQADGTWSGPKPTCSPVDCGKLEAPSNGRVQVSTTTYESTAKYSCLPNHELVGSDSRACQANGAWSGTAPTCKCSGSMCNGTCVDIKTDNANCGGCGKVCSALSPAKAECTPTGCLVTLAQGVTISDLAVDATHVYWTDSNNGKSGSVNKVPVGGGLATTLSTDQAFPSSIVVNATHVFWASVNEEAIRRVPIAGGATTTLASSVNGAGGLALNSTHLYYLSNLGVNRLPLAGGDPSVFVPADEGYAADLALTATHVFWRADILGSASIKSKIMKKSLVDGTGPTALIMSTSSGKLTADAGSVYWTSPDNLGGCVMTVPITGGAAMVLASDLGLPNYLTLDASHLYWTNGAGAQVTKLPIMGGTPTVLASGPNQIGNIAVDANSVYWVAVGASTSAIMKLTPK